MAPQPLPNILKIKPYQGGASSTPGAAKPIKLSSNENPLGASPAAKAAALAALEQPQLYPDGAHVALKAAIGASYGLETGRLICGAGSDEIFQFLGRTYLAPGDEIVQTQYAFLMYRLIALAAGAQAHTAPDRGFTADVDAMLALVSPRTKIVFLANPNNPTGSYLPKAEVARLHAGLPKDVLLVIDAAYAEYVDAADYSDGLDLARKHDNVLVTRTFSKIHGLASLRLGWAYGAAAVIDALNRVRGPFNVTAVAQAAGAAAIADRDFPARSAAHNRVELARVSAALEALGLAPAPSVANFVLVPFPEDEGRNAASADAFLRAEGVIVRDMLAYGLPHCLRFSIGTVAQNDRLLAALTAFRRRA